MATIFAFFFFFFFTSLFFLFFSFLLSFFFYRIVCGESRSTQLAIFTSHFLIIISINKGKNLDAKLPLYSKVLYTFDRG